ncbi:MAG: hypothetical protein U1F77_04305 [Kiritimatiellia bacterium]
MNNHDNYFSVKGNTLDDRPVPVPADETGYYTTATVDHRDRFSPGSCREPHRPAVFPVRRVHHHIFHYHLPEDIAKCRDRYLSGWDGMRSARLAGRKRWDC